MKRQSPLGPKTSSKPFAEEDDLTASGNPFAKDGNNPKKSRSSGLSEYFSSVNPSRSTSLPVQSSLPPEEIKPPLTPPQQERVEYIKKIKEQLSSSKKNLSKEEDVLFFTPEEIEKIRQATIAAFRADLLYKNDKNKNKTFRNPNQGQTDIINAIDEILKSKSNLSGGLESKEDLVREIQDQYAAQRKNYEKTTIRGIDKSTKDQAKTAAHIVKRTMVLFFSAVGVVIGAPIHALGVYLVEKGNKIEKDATAKIAKLDETKYDIYSSTKVDDLISKQEFGDRIQEIGIDVRGISPFEKNLDIIESIRKKNYAASETVTHVISAVKTNSGRGGAGK